MRIGDELAAWWPLLSRPEDHAEEAAWILNVIGETLGRKPKHILELGTGGGNIASHILGQVPMTLTDVSGRMLEISRRLNPNAEHVEADDITTTPFQHRTRNKQGRKRISGPVTGRVYQPLSYHVPGLC